MTVDAAANPASVDPAEVEKFARMAAEWWDPRGKFAPLHKFNPVRLAYIRDHVAGHFDRDPKAVQPLAGLRLLDIGCGGGILCEPMARLGAEVVGADPARASIEAARLHAAQSGLAIDYRMTDRRGPCRGGRDVRRGARHGGGRACRRPRRLHRGLRRLLRPGGLMFRRHHQPHAESLCARHRRRRIRAALAAARHARLCQARPPGRAGILAPRQPASR